MPRSVSGLMLFTALMAGTVHADGAANARAESPALRAAQARLDAAIKEVADLTAKELGIPRAEGQFELRVARGQEGAPEGTGERVERRLMMWMPDEEGGASGSSMPRGLPGPHLGMHGPFPEGHPPVGRYPDLQLATLSSTLGRYFGAQSGVLVTRAPVGSGLEDGDVILSIQGRQVTVAEQARRILETYGPAEPAPLTVWRDHKTVELQMHANGRKELTDH